MSDEARIDRLAEALDAALADPRAPLPGGEAELVELLAIANDLRALPRPAFKARLAVELTRSIEMTATAQTVRPGVREVIPYLVVRPALELVEFVERAFAADVLLRTVGSSGGVHTEVRIGETRLMIGGGGTWSGAPMPTGLHLYVPDADQVYRAALEAGAESLYAPVDQPYGDREAAVKDVGGNHWYIATHRAGGHIPEGLGTVTAFLHPR